MHADVAWGWRGTTFAVAKFDGVSGTELWRQEILGTDPMPFYNVAWAVTVDGTGDVVAAGRTRNIDSLYFTVIKFDGATGAVQWRQEIGPGYNHQARAVAVDGMGNVVVAGATGFGFRNPEFTVIKFDRTTGAELWRHVIYGIETDRGEATAVVVDAAGNVLAGGFITENNNIDHGLIVMKLNGIDGRQLWRQVIYGTASTLDPEQTSGVALDGAGNVVAAGFIRNADSNEDFTVAKFDGVSGAEQWRQVINGTANGIDQANGVAVDRAGNVIAAGITQNAVFGVDFTLLKLDGVSGAVSWCRAINRSTEGSPLDVANAVAVDGAGDAVATGYTAMRGIGNQFTVVKVRGTDGSDF
jgi:hypothetical protein